MTHAEASALVAILAAAFPNSRFSAENAVVYEKAICDLGPEETQWAVNELIHSSERLPSVAAIRAEVMRFRRQKTEEQMASERRALPGAVRSNGDEWRGTFARMADEGARYEAMARKWYAEKGKPYPGDPGVALVKVAAKRAAGDPVTIGEVLAAMDFRGPTRSG